MSQLICPHCRLSNGIDCQEKECPECFVPRTWQRPILQITMDLERYEALILRMAASMVRASSFEEADELARLLSEEALNIRTKHKKGGHYDVCL